MLGKPVYTKIQYRRKVNSRTNTTRIQCPVLIRKTGNNEHPETARHDTRHTDTQTHRQYLGIHRRDNTGDTLQNIRHGKLHRHRTTGDQVADYTGFVTPHHNKRDSVLQSTQTTQSGRWY